MFFLINIHNRFILKKISMGKGDIKTKRGKIFNGTFGVARPHKVTVIKIDADKKSKKTTVKKKAAK